MELSGSKERVLINFEKSKKEPFMVHRIDDHIFIRFNNTENNYWSPQLHLEIEESDDQNSRLHGVFGPNPTIWTFFMFLHFGVATVFVILGVWAYSGASLNRPYGLQIGFMLFTVLLWFVLYLVGRMGKKRGKPQMRQLYQFMMDTLSV